MYDKDHILVRLNVRQGPHTGTSTTYQYVLMYDKDRNA